MNRKLLFTIGTILTITTPVVTAISCSSSNNEQDKDQGEMSVEAEKKIIQEWFDVKKAELTYEINLMDHITSTWKDITNELAIALGQEEVIDLGVKSQVQYILEKNDEDAHAGERVQYNLSLSLLIDGENDPINSFTITLVNETITDVENIDSRKIANDILDAVENSFSSNESATIETLTNYTTKFRKPFTTEIANAIGIVGDFPDMPEGGQILYTMYFDGKEDGEKIETTIKFWGSMNGFLSTYLHYIEFNSSDVYNKETMPEVSDYDIAAAAYEKLKEAYTGAPTISEKIEKLDELIAESDVKFDQETANIFGLAGTHPTFEKNGQYASYKFVPGEYVDGQPVTYTLTIWGKKDNIKSWDFENDQYLQLVYTITSTDNYVQPTDDTTAPTDPNKEAANSAFALLQGAKFKYSEKEVSKDYMWLFNHEFKELMGENKRFTSSVKENMELAGKFPTLPTGSSAVYTLTKKSNITIMQRVKYDLKIWAVHGGVKSDEYIQIEMTSYDEAYLTDYPDIARITGRFPRGIFVKGKSLDVLNTGVLENSYFKPYNRDAITALLENPSEYISPTDEQLEGATLEYKISVHQYEIGQIALYYIEYRITFEGVSHVVKKTISSDIVREQFEGAQKDIDDIREELQNHNTPMNSSKSYVDLDRIVDSFGQGQDENDLPVATGPQALTQSAADALGIGLTLPTDLKGTTLTYEIWGDFHPSNYGLYIFRIYVEKDGHKTTVYHKFFSHDEMPDDWR